MAAISDNNEPPHVCNTYIACVSNDNYHRRELLHKHHSHVFCSLHGLRLILLMHACAVYFIAHAECDTIILQLCIMHMSMECRGYTRLVQFGGFVRASASV